ncbi:MAG: RNA polymerase sigma-70 factor [Bacteroidales bacterium]|nr:RNA polymerase sigma-70 factor [Bacteroidales bacterium]
MALSDKEIWEKIKKSDIKSFESLFCRYHDRLCLYSNDLIRDEDVSEEIVNDVFLKIWDKRDQIQINTGIKPYLFRCVFNACIDYINLNHKITQHFDTEIDQIINELAGSDEDYIFSLLQSKEVEKDVLNAIDLLPKQCRIIFCLSRFELLTYNEISERLNISVNTVKTQISRALDSLRKKLVKYL